MNAATAAGLLGGEVSAKFAGDGKQGGNCKFQSRTSDATLGIEVVVMNSPKTQFPAYLSQCGADPKPLKAIGNEAVCCTNGRQQTIVGRVRDQAFVITIEHVRITGPSPALKAAEIVAGNLF